MNRPKNWYELPWAIREDLVNRCELEYDEYESSFVEAVDNLLNEPTYHYYANNNKVVQYRYENMTDVELVEMAKGHIGYLKVQIEDIETMLKA